MRELFRFLYLQRKKFELKRTVKIRETIETCKEILIFIPREDGNAGLSLLFSINLAKQAKDRNFTLIAPKYLSSIISIASNDKKKLFKKVIFYEDKLRYGSEEFNRIKKDIKGCTVFLDFSSQPHPEVAAETESKLRIICQKRNVYPFYNVILPTSQAERFHRLARFIFPKFKFSTFSLKLPKSWIDNALNILKKRSLKKENLILWDIAESFPKGMNVLPLIEEEIDTETLTALFSIASLFVGRVSYKLNYGVIFNTPSLILSQNGLPFEPSIFKNIRILKDKKFIEKEIKKILLE